MMKKGYILLLCFWVVTIGYGQDLHFSNHEYTPMYINPALSGKFNADARFSLAHRNQWSSVTTPYETMAFTAETSRLFATNTLGGGLSMYRDVAGDSRFTNLKVDLALSYSFVLDERRTHAISLGLQGGINQFSLDYSKLRYDVQYDPDVGFNPNLPTLEFFSTDAVLNPSFSFGAVYHFRHPKYSIQTGFGLYNLLEPTLNFYETADNPYEKRVNIHFQGEIALSDFHYLIPSFLISEAQTLSETIAGISWRYVLEQNRIRKHFESGIRFRSSDALILTTGYHVNGLTGIISYDLNVSKLKESSNGFGAYELILIYELDRKAATIRKFKSCPVFL